MSNATTAGEKAYWQFMGKDSVEFAGGVAGTAPASLIKSELGKHYSTHDLHLAFRGRGHRAEDVAVFCPQKRKGPDGRTAKYWRNTRIFSPPDLRFARVPGKNVIATEDLLHSFAPFIADGYPRFWPRALRAAPEFDFTHVTGGHGGVQGSNLQLYQMAAYLEDLTGEVTKLKRQGRAVTDVKTIIDPGKLKSLSRDGYCDFLMISIGKYRLIQSGTARAQILSESLASNIEHVYDTIDKE